MVRCADDGVRYDEITLEKCKYEMAYEMRIVPQIKHRQKDFYP